MVARVYSHWYMGFKEKILSLTLFTYIYPNSYHRFQYFLSFPPEFCSVCHAFCSYSNGAKITTTLFFWVCRSCCEPGHFWTLWSYICIICTIFPWYSSFDMVSCIWCSLLWQVFHLSGWSSGKKWLWFIYYSL